MEHPIGTNTLPHRNASDSILGRHDEDDRTRAEQFPSTPITLLDPASKTTVKSLTFGIRTVLHHYYIAKYGDDRDDAGGYEYERFITSGPDWRFLGSGIGRDKESKRHVSNEIGKGFARWFLYTHLGLTYFCPFDDVLERKNADGSRWTRKEEGDLPDYVCGRDRSDVNLLEAKGRYHSVTFKTKEFDSFRSQIARAQLLDAKATPIQVKGFISVARWATEESPRVVAKLLVEEATRTQDDWRTRSARSRAADRRSSRRNTAIAVAIGNRIPLTSLVIRSRLRVAIAIAARAGARRFPAQRAFQRFGLRDFTGDRRTRETGNAFAPFKRDTPRRLTVRAGRKGRFALPRRTRRPRRSQR